MKVKGMSFMNKLLSASIMCADLMNMQSSIKEIENAGVDWLHVDVMDGDFVPNITLGFDTVNAVKAVSNIPLDVHMIVSEPIRFIDMMKLTGEDYITVHYEACKDIEKTLRYIRQKGCKVGLAINPQTPLSDAEKYLGLIDMLLVMTVNPGFAGQKIFDGAFEKATQVRQRLNELGYSDMLIQVDGNISPENGMKLSRCGADVFVLGTSSLFIKGKNMKDSAESFRALL